MLGKTCNVVVVPEIHYTMRYVGYSSPPKTSRHHQGVLADQVSITFRCPREKKKLVRQEEGNRWQELWSRSAPARAVLRMCTIAIA